MRRRPLGGWMWPIRRRLARVRSREWQRQHMRALVVALALALLGVALLAFFLLPPALVPERGLSPNEVLEREHDARVASLQLLAGLVVAAGGLFTAWNVVLNRHAQLTERFTRAVDQLGHERLAVRLGAIYALDRIARDSVEDRWAIGELLSGYIRERAPSPSGSGDDEPARPTTDVQAALTVLGRYGRSAGPGFRLDGIDLRGASLSGAQLQHADLSGTHLDGADLEAADLRFAVLTHARLRLARLGAARLDSAYLGGAVLTGAELSMTSFRRANVAGAFLRGTYLNSTDLRDAIFDGNTEWPGGFDPVAAGARRTASTDHYG